MLMLATINLVAGPPNVVLADVNACTSIPPINGHTGDEWGGNHYGVKGTIDIYSTTYFRACDTAGNVHIDDNGVNVYVGIEGPSSNSAAILQIGIANCHDAGTPPADSACGNGKEHTLRYYYAYGGCNGVNPNPKDLGAANASPHVYEVFLSGTMWVFKIDGVTKVTLFNTNSSISCWINGTTKSPAWYAERWDNGDSYGDTSGHEILITQRYYTNVADGAYIQALISSSCVIDGDAHCTHPNNTYAKIWDD
jgi:hypothetical protein